MSDWDYKKLGRIADEMREIDSVEGIFEYSSKIIGSCTEQDKAELRIANMTPSEWFWEMVRFIDERDNLPAAWREVS